MNTIEVIEDTIKYHPEITFSDTAMGGSDHWSCCPCGFTTSRSAHTLKVHQEFEAHLAEEVNEALFSAQGLRLAIQEYAPRRLRTGGLPLSVTA